MMDKKFFLDFILIQDLKRSALFAYRNTDHNIRGFNKYYWYFGVFLVESFHEFVSMHFSNFPIIFEIMINEMLLIFSTF